MCLNFSVSFSTTESKSVCTIVTLKEARAVNWQSNLYQNHYLRKHATCIVIGHFSVSQWSQGEFQLVQKLKQTPCLVIFFLFQPPSWAV